MSMAPTECTYSQFACIGSGFAGICLGATLKRWYGITDVHFFERRSDLGGTWFANKYPGCACDIPSALYSFSFAPMKWTHPLSSSDELWSYLKDVANEYDLEREMSFRCEVVRCEWQEAASRWRMHVRNLDTDETQLHDCQFLFSGSGLLVRPNPCDIPGAQSFKGPLFHSANWRQDVDLTGKKVVLLGNGCTAAQIVPNIVHKTKHLTQFVRSKAWIMAPFNIPDNRLWNSFLSSVPVAMRIFRLAVFLVCENYSRGFSMTRAGERFRNFEERSAIEYVKATAPAKYHDLLIPDFAIGCKRRIIDPGYCKALHAENLSLSDEPVVEIVPDGVKTRDGAFTEADIIIMANGFYTHHFLDGIQLIGRSGKTLFEHWADWGGAEAYKNCALNDFPNFFMLLGPNSATGNTSTLMAIENDVNYAMRVIKPVLDGEARYAEVRRDAEERYSREMQAALQKTVYSSGCNTWYIKEDDEGNKWNDMTYPHWQAVYWYESLFVKFRDWHYPPTADAGRLRFQRKTRNLIKWSLLLVAALATGSFVLKHRYAWPGYRFMNQSAILY